MASLVIVESPSKSKTIKKYLGKGYDVIASKGHIIDLPKSKIGVDPENKYKASYEVTKKATVKQLKAAFKDKDELILAVDLDREGEAIGWHVAQKLGVITPSGKVKKGMKLKRIVFTSITEKSVQDAMKNPRKLDMDLVNAQQARRILDRLVGYELSPLLWKKIRFGLSAGRVQSVAVKLVVEREEEREKFVPEEYWSVGADVAQSKTDSIKISVINSDGEKLESSEDNLFFELVKVNDKKANISDKKSTEEILDIIKKEKWIITDLKKKSSKRNPKPPFTTSTLQQTASNWFGYSAKRTMIVAQKLYEAGHITYMRTDSVNLAPQAVAEARKVVTKKYGKEFLPEKPNFYKTKAKVAQEAHEAVRPTSFAKTGSTLGLTLEALKLYDLIHQRALSSQMVPAIVEGGTLEILVDTYLFRTNGQRVTFKGYLAVYPEKISDNPLPDNVKVGQELFPEWIAGVQHFTQPIARFTEASLIKALESYGIGRPSTYVPIISTIQTRKYVEKEGRSFIPTDTGRVVTNLLRDHFSEIVDYEFSAGIEDKLDDVASGKANWVDVLDEVYKPFHKKLEKKTDSIDRSAYTVLGKAPKKIKCPDCKKAMLIKLGRYGRFYSCKDWPDCKGMLGMDGKTEAEHAQEAYTEDFLKIYKPSPKTDEKKDFILKRGRYGKFWAHPGYPKVKDARPLEYTNKVFKKIYGETPKGKDGKKLILRRGRFGEFWAHKKYPKVKEVVKIDKKEVAEKKKEMGLS